MRIGYLILALFTLMWTIFARPLMRWKLGVYRKIGMGSWANFFEKIFDPWCVFVTIVSGGLTLLFALIGFRVIPW